MKILKLIALKIIKKQGFSTVEMVVVVLILVSISVILIANIRGGITSDELRIARSQLIQDFKKMQNHALAGKICTQADDALACPAAGSSDFDYGIYISQCLTGTCSYYLFVDADVTPPSDDDKYSSITEVLKYIGLKKIGGTGITVTMRAVLDTGSAYTPSNAHIVFEPYSGDIKLNTTPVYANIEKIKIKLQKGSQIKEFIINKVSGVIVEEISPLDVNM